MCRLRFYLKYDDGSFVNSIGPTGLIHYGNPKIFTLKEIRIALFKIYYKKYFEIYKVRI